MSSLEINTFSSVSRRISAWIARFAWVGTPIRALGANHRQRIASHLLALNAQDRYLRFGYPAQDSQITRYVEGLNFERDEVLGIYDRRLELVAVAHLAYGSSGSDQSSVEFGVSVARQARGQGYGARLFARAAIRARNLGVKTMHIHALSENTAMLKIARAAGAEVHRDGSESQAYLQLPEATLLSRAGEIVQERLAKIDFRLKLRVRQIEALVGGPRQVL